MKARNESKAHVVLVALSSYCLQSVRFRLSDSGGGVFRITNTGQVLLDSNLDFEESHSQEYRLKIYVTDGKYVSRN